MHAKPFIPTQRIVRLEAPPERRRECLEPQRYRTWRLQRSGGEPDAPEYPDLPDDCRWVQQPDRRAFLGDLSHSRLCLLVDAGVGLEAWIRPFTDGRSEGGKDPPCRAVPNSAG